MKARDLIAKLTELDPEAEILAQDCAHCEGQEEPVIVIEEHWRQDGRLFLRAISQWEADIIAKHAALKGDLIAGEIEP